MSDAVIVGAARIPIGRFGGGLREGGDWGMGTIVIAEALKRGGVKGEPEIIYPDKKRFSLLDLILQETLQKTLESLRENLSQPNFLFLMPPPE